MARPTKTKTQKEFAYWLATPKRMRQAIGLPQSERQFADMKGVNPSTLRRWKAQKDFKALVESFKAEMATAPAEYAIDMVGMPLAVKTKDDIPKIVIPADPEENISADERNYLAVKETLVDMATNGNQGAIDLYMKHYGKSFLEAEREEFSDYRQMSDEQLASEVMSFLGVDAVSDWLASRVAAEV